MKAFPLVNGMQVMYKVHTTRKLNQVAGFVVGNDDKIIFVTAHRDRQRNVTYHTTRIEIESKGSCGHEHKLYVWHCMN